MGRDLRLLLCSRFALNLCGKRIREATMQHFLICFHPSHQYWYLRWIKGSIFSEVPLLDEEGKPKWLFLCLPIQISPDRHTHSTEHHCCLLKNKQCVQCLATKRVCLSTISAKVTLKERILGVCVFHGDSLGNRNHSETETSFPGLYSWLSDSNFSSLLKSC